MPTLLTELFFLEKLGAIKKTCCADSSWFKLALECIIHLQIPWPVHLYAICFSRIYIQFSQSTRIHLFPEIIQAQFHGKQSVVSSDAKQSSISTRNLRTYLLSQLKSDMTKFWCSEGETRGLSISEAFDSRSLSVHIAKVSGVETAEQLTLSYMSDCHHEQSTNRLGSCSID